MSLTQTIHAQETALYAAQLAGDVAALNTLVADDVLFTGIGGQRFTKQDDLEAYRQGHMHVDTLEALEPEIRILSDSTAVAAVQATISGTYMGQPMSGRFYYTRVWAQRGSRWQIVAAHMSM